MNRFFILSSVLVCLTATSAIAQSDKYEVDPVHSSVVFGVKHSNVNSVHGLFSDIKGHFSADDKGTFDVSVGVDSINSGNEGRDKHLKSPDFFSAKQYPRVQFKSKSAKSIEGGVEIQGEVTMRGITKPIVAKMKMAKGKGRDGGPIAGLEGSFTVKRSDFKLGGPGLGDEVTIMVSLQGKKK